MRLQGRRYKQPIPASAPKAIVKSNKIRSLNMIWCVRYMKTKGVACVQAYSYVCKDERAWVFGNAVASMEAVQVRYL